MQVSEGVRLAHLLIGSFEAMVDEVVSDLAGREHPGVTASLEFALTAIDQGASTASDLGRQLGISKQAAAKSIATLEQLGYVARTTDAQDRRRAVLQVSDQGREMITLGATKFDEIRQRWIASLQPGEAEIVEAALAKLHTRPSPTD
ncbi:MarR family transcriptional regulator [Aeromicrobium sp. CFBP 8757]|uniref:MarR family winged helix-turn-helix transcriptional regulator n=1 Tax=Aeromicrobium sp. CFBP 8757 TaxID=2775288 RepID=UPI0017829002|nr:MarR family transcriptional regulator [Aeromicrobium sp. CFBP 8757]MBD8605415.1 MarR family transcriptional regulator [Aeromicrobium sp. CFBP 8757]